MLLALKLAAIPPNGYLSVSTIALTYKSLLYCPISSIGIFLTAFQVHNQKKLKISAS